MIATALDANEKYSTWVDTYVERLCPGDYVALILTHRPNAFRFDYAEAHTIKDKPIVCLDLREYGWDTSYKNCDLSGFQREEQPMYSGSEWENLEGWLQGQNIVAYFKRELTPEVRQLTPPYPVYPIDLMSGRNGVGVIPTTKDQYMARTGGIMHWWGHSHEDRPELWVALREHPEIPHDTKLIHHLERIALAKVLEHQMGFHLSVSLPGAGVKCFRHSESCVNCVPVVSDCGMEFSVPWTQDNAVILPTVGGRINPEQSLQIIKDSLLDKETLWGKYQRAQVAAQLLEQNTYVSMFVNPHIQAAL